MCAVHGHRSTTERPRAHRVWTGGDGYCQTQTSAWRLCSGDGGVAHRPPAVRRRGTKDRGHSHAQVGALAWPRRRQGEALPSSEDPGGAQVQAGAQLRPSRTLANTHTLLLIARSGDSLGTRAHVWSRHGRGGHDTHGGVTTMAVKTARTSAPHYAASTDKGGRPSSPRGS